MMRMRIILFLVGLALLGPHPKGWSQSLELKDSFGVAGGITSFNQNLSNAFGPVDAGGTYLVGMFTGVFAEMPLTRDLAFSPGLFFSQKGTQSTSERFTVNYLETLAQLRWFFVNDPSFRAYLGGGAGLGILMSAELFQNTGTVSDVFSEFAKNELSLQGGVGLEFSLSRETALQVGASYVRGLSSNLVRRDLSGNWDGIYAFTAIRFKGVEEDNTPEKRARSFVKFKNKNDLGREISSFDDDPTKNQFVDETNSAFAESTPNKNTPDIWDRQDEVSHWESGKETEW